MLESQIEREERRRVLLNDKKVRDQAQGSTYLQHQHSDLGGRYTQVSPENVVGRTPNPYSSLPKMPAGNPWAFDPVPPEESLGYRIDDLEPTTPLAAQAGGSAFLAGGVGSPRNSLGPVVSSPLVVAQATGEPTDAAPLLATPGDVERRDVGSPPFRRFR
jgi:hypothetical protein